MLRASIKLVKNMPNYKKQTKRHGDKSARR